MEDWVNLDKMEGVGETEIEVTVPANPLEEERTTEILIKSGKYEKSATVVQKKAEHVVVIPEFDSLVISYEWDDNAGKDFDTATAFLNTNIPGVDNMLVGWSREMAATTWQVGDYLRHGGDNLKSGEEAVLVDMNELLSPTNMPKLPEDIMIGVWGNWYEHKGSGKVTVRFTAYKGGKMYRQGTGFINRGGETVYEGTADTVVSAFGQDNNIDPVKYYTKIATIIYNKNSRDCFIQL